MPKALTPSHPCIHPSSQPPRCRQIVLQFAATALLLSTAVHTARADVYVSEYVENAIYKYADDGTRTTLSSKVNEPVGLVFDTAGNLYEADSGSGTVYKFAPDGTQSTFASGFDHLLGLAFDAAGNLFVAAVDANNNGSIVKITPAGVQSTFATGLARARGIAFDAVGNLYTDDLDSGNVYRYTPAGVQSVFASGFNYPTGLAFDAAGNLFVASQAVGIFKISPAGVVSTFSTAATDPRYLAFDAAGNLYVTDDGDASGTQGQGKVYLFGPDGTLQKTFASDLSYPTGIVLHSATIIAPTPTVSTATVVGSDPDANAGTGQVGDFVVTLSAPAAIDLKVAYTIKGSATPGVDYIALKGTVKIKAGKTSKAIAVVPEGDLGGASKKVVKLTLAAGTGYTVGTTGPVKVKITKSNVITLP